MRVSAVTVRDSFSEEKIYSHHRIDRGISLLLSQPLRSLLTAASCKRQFLSITSTSEQEASGSSERPS